MIIKHIKFKVMKNLPSAGICCMFLFLYIGFASCNKEPLSEQKTGEEQVRILRVERYSGTYKGAPFFNDNSGAVLYEYDNVGKLKNIKVYADHSYRQESQILEYDVIHQAGSGNSSMEFRLKKRPDFVDKGFFIEELRISFKNSRFVSSFYTTKNYFDNIIYTFTSKTSFSTKYSDPQLSESCSESNAEYGESDPETHRKLLRSSCFQTDTSGRITSIFKIGKTFMFATNELLEEDRYNLEETFEYYNDDFSIPKGLIKHINGAIFGSYYFGMEESYNLFTINSATSPPQNSNNNNAFQDWIFSFGLPQALNGYSNHLIKSKHIQGEKNVGFEGFEDTYIFKNIDSTATFPYTHDPVAKTLEIAGLKIWYEVVD
jgi:hypothetical protein